jgi:hypothetical protein
LGRSPTTRVPLVLSNYPVLKIPTASVQAFTIPSFRLIAFIEKNDNTDKLINLDDPRIWIIGGKMDNDSNLHYFNQIVHQLLPDLNNNEIDENIEKIIKLLG